MAEYQQDKEKRRVPIFPQIKFSTEKRIKKFVALETQGSTRILSNPKRSRAKANTKKKNTRIHEDRKLPGEEKQTLP